MMGKYRQKLDIVLQVLAENWQTKTPIIFNIWCHVDEMKSNIRSALPERVVFITENRSRANKTLWQDRLRQLVLWWTQPTTKHVTYLLTSITCIFITLHIITISQLFQTFPVAGWNDWFPANEEYFPFKKPSVLLCLFALKRHSSFMQLKYRRDITWAGRTHIEI